MNGTDIKDRSPCGVIFVHGIQGGPARFRGLTELLPPSVVYKNVLLPGHGKTVKEFRRSGTEQWMRALREECEEMRAGCRRLIFVGHSMGRLLGLNVQEELSCFSGMILHCCPFKIRPTPGRFKNSLIAAASKKRPKDRFAAASWDENSVSAKCPLSYLTAVHPYLDLLRMIKDAKRREFHPPIPTKFIFSELDEIVSPGSAARSKEIAGAETVILEGCGHEYMTGKAKEFIARELLDMLED